MMMREKRESEMSGRPPSLWPGGTGRVTFSPRLTRLMLERTELVRVTCISR